MQCNALWSCSSRHMSKEIGSVLGLSVSFDSICCQTPGTAAQTSPHCCVTDSACCLQFHPHTRLARLPALACVCRPRLVCVSLSFLFPFSYSFHFFFSFSLSPPPPISLWTLFSLVVLVQKYCWLSRSLFVCFSFHSLVCLYVFPNRNVLVVSFCHFP